MLCTYINIVGGWPAVVFMVPPRISADGKYIITQNGSKGFLNKRGRFKSREYNKGVSIQNGGSSMEARDLLSRRDGTENDFLSSVNRPINDYLSGVNGLINDYLSGVKGQANDYISRASVNDHLLRAGGSTGNRLPQQSLEGGRPAVGYGQWTQGNIYTKQSQRNRSVLDLYNFLEVSLWSLH